jgi:hypothetical protein
MAKKLNIADFQIRALRRSRDRVAGALKDLCASVVADTPVLTGALRANWRFSVGSPDTTVHDGFSDPTTQITSNIDALVVDTDQRYFFTNPLPYADRIEHGWSDKAPAGMLRKNMARFQGLLRRRLK